MNQSRNWSIFFIGTVVIVVGGIFFFTRHIKENTGSIVPTTHSTSTNVSSGTSSATTTVLGVTGNGSFTVALDAPKDHLPPAPDFRAPIVFSADTAGDVRAQIQSEANILIGRLVKNKSDLHSWIDLGTLHKMGGDYKGAEIIWQFVAKAAPANAIAFENLGDLYQNFLKDYPKAETNLLMAVKLSPSDPNPYRSLFTLYTSAYKTGTSAAEDILKKGIAANPQAVDLRVLLARHYKSLGRAADARAEYDAAIASAKSQGQTQLATQIQQEEGGV